MKAVSFALMLITTLLPASQMMASAATTARTTAQACAAGAANQAALAAAAAPSQAAHERASIALGELPLRFEANRGQADPRVKYLARTEGYTLALAATEATMTLGGVEAPAVGATLRMKLIRANPQATVAGADELPGRVNYFSGTDRRRWHTDIKTYARVRYEEVYPGVDMVYYGRGPQLEYDFLVAPGADPRRIRLGFEGVDNVKIDEEGDLVLQVGVSQVRQQRPIVYQETDGRRREIRSWYVVGRHGEIGFEVAEYDRTRPLVIDPVIVYSTYLGRERNDRGTDIAVDSEGNAYMVGDLEFPPVAPGESSNRDAFVQKFDPTGTTLLYTTYLGGARTEDGTAIAIDSEGNAYITGVTHSFDNDFPTTEGAYSRRLVESSDAFITKLNAAGQIAYSTLFNAEAGHGIAADSTGKVYVTGEAGFGFPTTPGAFQPTCYYECRFNKDAFVAKFDSSQSGTASLVYSTYLGGSGSVFDGSGNDKGLAVTVDSEGNAIVTGQTGSADFPVRNPIQATHSGGSSDAFVTKINASGSALLYSTFLGTRDFDSGEDVAVDHSGNMYVTGSTGWYDFPTTPGAIQTEWSANQCGIFGSTGCTDAFVTKFDAAGRILYSTYLGGILREYGNSIAVDAAGYVYITGYTLSFSYNFPLVDPLPSDGGINSNNSGFVAKLNPAGAGPADVIFSTHLGGSNKDEGNGIAVDHGGNIYVTGYTESSDFPVRNPVQPSTGGGDTDAFVTKIGGGISPQPTPTPTPEPSPTPAPGDPCTGCERYTGSLSAAGSADIQPDGNYFESTSSGSHNGWLRGPSGTDFDLYLLWWNGSEWVAVASSESSTSEEQVSFYGTPGYYAWRVYAYSGSGGYQFWMHRPS